MARSQCGGVRLIEPQRPIATLSIGEFDHSAWKTLDMSHDTPDRVTLSGARSGDYVIVEQRADGTLLIAPESSPRPPSPPKKTRRSIIGELFTSPSDEPATVLEALGGWGVSLAPNEQVREFMVADFDGRSGFVALTTERLILLTQGRRKMTEISELRLAQMLEVELVRRAGRPTLRVRSGASESIIGSPHKAAIERLHYCLTETTTT